MSQGSGHDNGATRPHFHIPVEILSVIPSDPFEQLDLARKITCMAIASRVSTLESDMARLTQNLFEKDRIIYDAQSKLKTALLDNIKLSQERDRLEATAKKLSLELDQIKISEERDQLEASAKKLSRDLAKLQTFKKQLMQSLDDDNPSQSETIDIGTCDQSVPKAYPDKDDDGSSYKAHESHIGPTDVAKTIDEDSEYAGPRFSMTPNITPHLTPTGTPKVISTTGSPKKTSGATSPIKLPYERSLSFSSWISSSQQSSAANSPPRGHSLSGHSPRIDGMEFFRQARSRLSYEQFSAFLANIKELNAQKQTREETLRKADEIFGSDNNDLYLSFQGLLSQNVH